MASCESCGKKVENPIKCKIEGVELKVCKECSKFGEIVRNKPKIDNFNSIKFKKRRKKEKIIVANAPELLKAERERRKMRQIDLAKMLQIKESLIHHIETREIALTIQLGEKIDEVLGLELVKELEID